MTENPKLFELQKEEELLKALLDETIRRITNFEELKKPVPNELLIRRVHLTNDLEMVRGKIAIFTNYN